MQGSWFTALALAATAGLATGCVRRELPPATGGSGVEVMDGQCPMAISDATVEAVDVEGGAAIAFVTSTGDEARLRAQVRRMADMHNQNRMNGKPMGHGHGGMMPGGMMIPASTASVEEIQGGARLVLRPKDLSQLEAIREHVRMRAQRMAAGECPMMTMPPR